MIHVYCGDGKGKTTASIGLAVRAAGSGLSVLFAQFLKARPTGEIAVLSSIDRITVLRVGSSEKFTFQLKEDERRRQREENQRMLKQIFQKASEDSADLLILDEAITAVTTDLLDEELLRTYVESFPEDRELVLTGRSPERWMSRTWKRSVTLLIQARKHAEESNIDDGKNGI